MFGASAYEGGGRSPVAISLAIGGATLPADGRTATELIAAADGGLYREKRAPGVHPDPSPSGSRASKVRRDRMRPSPPDARADQYESTGRDRREYQRAGWTRAPSDRHAHLRT